MWIVGTIVFLPLLLCCILASGSTLGADPESGPPTAEQALILLEEGNKRFAEGRPKHDHTSADWRTGLTAGQHPFATILGCSDSRVPTELVFDQGFGDLFVIRNAGNVVGKDVLASIEYAGKHLGVRLNVVMGHEQCGAVTAALASADERAQEPREVQEILKRIDRGLSRLELPEDPALQVSAGVEANVRYVVEQLRKGTENRKPEGWEEIRFVGAVYELSTGRVRFLEDSPAPTTGK
jgi:carbonic anhydrase